MSIDAAIARLTDLLRHPLSLESVPLAQANGRILAQDLRVQFDRPQWDNSAMDGYALRHADLEAGHLRLPLAGTLAAGDGIRELPPGQCLQIFTGAPLPQGADTVVPQEACRREAGQVIFEAVKEGAHIRRRGEELKAGEPLLGAGTRLRPQEIGLLASQGHASLPVWQPMRIGLVTSGNELRPPGSQLEPGQIYDTNGPLLASILRGWGCALTLYPSLGDRLDESIEQLRKASLEQDILITSGGVSVGEADYLKQAVQALGQLDLWRVAIQPGKPLAFGRVCGTPWVGLPGNPAASLITALIILRPALLAAAGQAQTRALSFQVPAAFDWPKAKGRQQYLQARLEEGHASLHPQQGSAMLTNCSWAEGLVVIAPGESIARGEPVTFIPYPALY